jgi:uncharacterized protein YggU (UPF0235/DUF167 family)
MSGSATPFWRAAGNRVLVRVRVTPRGGRDAIEGVTETAEGPALAVRVRAVPEGGAANASVEVALADWLGCARSEVSVTAGRKSRIKTVSIAGNAADLHAWLSGLVADLPEAGRKSGRG